MGIFLTCPAGGATISEITCDTWHVATTASSFSRVVHHMYEPLKLKLTVRDKYTDREKTAQKTVRVYPLIGTDNYPNPFNPTTDIAITLVEPMRVSLTVYDALGREVSRLADHMFSAGTHRIRFDGSSVPSGLYLYLLRAGDYSASGSMMLVK